MALVVKLVHLLCVLDLIEMDNDQVIDLDCWRSEKLHNLSENWWSEGFEY